MLGPYEIGISRVFVREKGVAFAIAATIALCVMASASIFSVIYAVALAPLPVKDSDSVLAVHETYGKDRQVQGRVSLGVFGALQRSVLLNQVAASTSGVGIVSDSQGAEQTRVLRVSANYIPLLGLQLQLGREFSATECDDAGATVVILTDSLWRSKYGAALDVVGKAMRINNSICTVIGILAPNRWIDRQCSMLLPMVLPKTHQQLFTGSSLVVYGRIRNGSTVDAVRGELQGIYLHLKTEFPNILGERNISVVPIQTEETAEALRISKLLLAALTMLVAIGCCNAGNLMLTRAVAQSPDTTIRVALGARKAHLLTRVVAEAGILAVAGVLVGLACATIAVLLLRSLVPSSYLIEPIALGWPTIGFSATIGAIIAIVISLPAEFYNVRRYSKVLRAEPGATQFDKKGIMAMQLLVTLQVGLVIVLTTAAGLIANTYYKQVTMRQGYNPKNVYFTPIMAPDLRKLGFEERVVRLQQLADTAANEGEISQATISSSVPLAGIVPVQVYSYEANQVKIPCVYNAVSTSYFSTLRVALLSGRVFDQNDTPNSDAVVIVSRRLATQLFRNDNPLGKRISLAKDKWKTIVGVVDDVRPDGPIDTDASTMSYVYEPITQNDEISVYWLVFRLSTGGSDVVALLKGILHTWDSSIAIGRVFSLAETLADYTRRQKMTLVVFSAYATIAAALAIAGVYAVFAYSVHIRRREIAIRIAIGAARSDILFMLLQRCVALTTIATVGGMFMFYCLYTWLRAYQNELGAIDPRSIGLTIVAIFICAISGVTPAAIKAMNIAPSDLLRV